MNNFKTLVLFVKIRRWKNGDLTDFQVPNFENYAQL